MLVHRLLASRSTVQRVEGVACEPELRIRSIGTVSIRSNLTRHNKVRIVKEFTAPKGAGHLNTIIVAGGIALAIGVSLCGCYIRSTKSGWLTGTPREVVEDEPQDEEETDEPEAIEEPEPLTAKKR